MSSPEWLDTALHIGEPLGGIVLGYLATALRYRKKIKSLDGEDKRLREAIERYKLALEAAIHAARAAAVEGDKAAMARHEQRLQEMMRALGTNLLRLENDINKLREEHTTNVRSSATDHATAAGLARDMLEVREQCTETLALLNEIRGYLKATGAKL